jgi:hypothetical protein
MCMYINIIFNLPSLYVPTNISFSSYVRVLSLKGVSSIPFFFGGHQQIYGGLCTITVFIDEYNLLLLHTETFFFSCNPPYPRTAE